MRDLQICKDIYARLSFIMINGSRCFERIAPHPAKTVVDIGLIYVVGISLKLSPITEM